MNRLGILFALVLVGLGAGVVRPFAVRKASEAWQPVLEDLRRVPFQSGVELDLQEPGDYVVFVEGDATDPMWLQPGGPRAWAELVESSSHRALSSTVHGIDYEYEVGGRRGTAVAKVTVRTPGYFALEGKVEGVDETDDPERFQAAIGRAGLVDAQAWKSSTWFVTGIAALALMGLAAVALVVKPRS